MCLCIGHFMPVRFLQNVNVTDAFARDSATKNVHLSSSGWFLKFQKAESSNPIKYTALYSKAIHHHALSAGRKCYRSFQWTRYPSKHLIPLVQLLSDRQLGQAIEIFLSRIRITPAQSWKIAEYHHNFEIRWLSGIRTIEGTASCFRAVLWKIWSSHNMRGAGCWSRYILQPYVTQQARQRLVW